MTTAGKSGTAELGGTGEPRSWFIGFAPAAAPTVAIAVLVEQGGRGAEAAAPIAGDLMTRYLEGAQVTDPGVGSDAPGPDAAARPDAPGSDALGSGQGVDAPPADRTARPIIERIGLAAVAAVSATLFGGVAAASWVGGEPFLAAMGGVGCLMTIWVGLITLVRG